MSPRSGHRRPLWVDVIILFLAGCALISFIRLGNWQVERLAWKVDLIERVESRAFQAPVAAPESDLAPEYQRVSVEGIYLHEHSLKVKALTDLGAGHWVLTPLDTGETRFWINRGFVPSGLPQSDWQTPFGPQKFEGLARHSVPGGTVMENNAPEWGRWVSVDVALMSETMGLEEVAPYYIAADHMGPQAAWPRGGLTKVTFRNSHLSYALTWYAMAVLFAAAMGYVIWDMLRSDPREGMVRRSPTP